MNSPEKPALIDFGDRLTAETLLGVSYSPRVYQTHDNVSRGICEIRVCGVNLACTAYSIDGGRFAQGVLVNRRDGSPSLILTNGDTRASQSELAEAVDYWESPNDNRIFCLHEKSCGAVVFTGDGEQRKYLMIRMNLGHCGLPKGHIEKFETEEMAAVREIREETGVDAKLIPGFRETVEYPISAKTRKMSVYFVGRFDGGDVRIQESEIKSYRLCPYAEAREFITHDNDRAVFDSAVAWLNKRGY